MAALSKVCSLVVDNRLPHPLSLPPVPLHVIQAQLLSNIAILGTVHRVSAKVPISGTIHFHASLTPPHILACYSPSKLLLSNRLTGFYVNTMQLMILSLIPIPALKWFWDKTQADWNLDAFLLPAVSTFIHSNSCYSSSVAKQETNKTSASLKSQMCSIFIYTVTLYGYYI